MSAALQVRCYSALAIQRMFERFHEGADTAEIARELGVCEAEIYNAMHAYAHKYGWPKRKDRGSENGG